MVLEEVKQDDVVCLDDLSFNDVADLCANIEKLDNTTKTNLMKYIKKLTKTNPSKVQELKKYINIDVLLLTSKRVLVFSIFHDFCFSRKCYKV